MANKYDAHAIEVLKGLEPVQKRPGMYTITTCPNHLAQEVIDNSADEALAGHASKITVTLYADNSLSVEDDGRGMPVDKHPVEKVSGVELILTRLHAGAKFSQSSYRFSGGLHGVGVSVVNALSKKLHVKVFRDGKQYEMSFEHGAPAKPLKNTGKVPKKQVGTVITFWPDKKYFDTHQFQTPRLEQLLKAKAVLCPGLEIVFINKQEKKETTWCYENGLKTYFIDTLAGHDLVSGESISGHQQEESYDLDYAIAWTHESGSYLQESYVNLVPTIQGGTHVNGLRIGILEAMKQFCQSRNLLPKQIKLTADDVWSDCQYVLSIKMHEPQFAGQTKERLSSRQASSIVAKAIENHFSLWLHQHASLGEEIAKHVIEKAQSRQQSAKIVKRKKIVQGPALPGKLADCTVHDPMQSELFLVEGDSAGGSAKQARDKKIQAIMPLRGKILNTWEVNVQQILASQEVHDIAIAIGVDPDSNDLEQIRYGKICILADADSDGAHIATLLCALFLKHFRPLVQAGHVFVAMPPLFRIDVGKEVSYALDEEEKQAIVAKIQHSKPRANINVQRFKGLGEMNPKQLRETTMDPSTRRLVQLVLEDESRADQTLDMLLAKKRVQDRKAWLEENGDLAEV